MKSPDNITSQPTLVQKLVCCAVEEREFCFALSEVRSLMRAHQMTPATETDAAPAPLGWVTVQQEQIPVYDLAARLRLAAPTTTEGFIVVFNTAPSFALRVDRITGSVELPNAQLLALPPIVTAGVEAFFKGLAQVEGRWIPCADAQRLHPTPATCSHTVPSHLATITAAFSITANRTAAPQIVLFTPLTANDAPVLFGLSMAQVQEVAAMTPILPLPQAPPYVLGITNWRGVPVPVVDLEMRLGLTTRTPPAIVTEGRLLVACGPQQRGLIGVLVQPHVKTLRLPLSYAPLSQPLVSTPGFVKGAFEWEGKSLVIPDLDAVLAVEQAYAGKA
ncbi:MAG: chemotaxis protein CheW [Blastocatellia bacterium]